MQRIRSIQHYFFELYVLSDWRHGWVGMWILGLWDWCAGRSEGGHLDIGVPDTHSILYVSKGVEDLFAYRNSIPRPLSLSGRSIFASGSF